MQSKLANGLQCYQSSNNVSTPYWTYERSSFGSYPHSHTQHTHHTSGAQMASQMPAMGAMTAMPPPMPPTTQWPHTMAHTLPHNRTHTQHTQHPSRASAHTSLALTPSAQTMWSPIDYPYGYVNRHQMHNVCHNANHMQSCCVHQNHWQTRCVGCEPSQQSHHCGNTCHNSCNNCNTCSRCNSHSNDTKAEANCDNSDDLSDNVASVTASDNSCVQTNDDISGNVDVIEDDVSELAQLRGFNETLRLSLEETTKRLHKTQQLLNKANEKHALDYIDKYRQNLKKFGDYIKEECTRFYQNESIAKILEPIVEQVTNASNKAKEEKERVRLEVTSIEHKLSDELNDICGGNASETSTATTSASPPMTQTFNFDFNCLPDYPDLLQFYKNILDQIPLAFLSDLSQLKKCAVKYIESKNQMNTNRFDFNHYNCVPQHEAIDASKPDSPFVTMHDSLFASTITTLSTNMAQNCVVDKSVESTLTSMPTLSMSLSSTPKDEKPNILPIGQSYATEKKDIIVNYSKNSQSKENIAPTDPIVSSLQNVANQSLISNMNDTLQLNTTTRKNDNNCAQKLSQAQIKLLAKLKEKYNHLSDEELVESITQTKATLVNSGNPKGFSGMKVIDIIAKISAYIDSNMIASITDSRTWPQLGDSQQLNGF